MKIQNIPSYLKLCVRRICREVFILKRQREQLRNKEFTIFSSTCNGGVLYSDLKIRFDSPTINIWMMPDDFLEMIENLEYYMSCPLIEEREKEVDYPVGVLGNKVHIFFQHYRTFEEALTKWELRKSRIHWDNLYFMMTDRNDCTEEQIKRFDSLPYQNKIIFTSESYPQYRSAVYCEEFSAQGQVGVLTEYRNMKGERLYDRYVDFVKWFNGEEKYVLVEGGELND